jgi:glucokinase
VRRVYAREAGIAMDMCPEPFEIYRIAKGEAEGNRTAAQEGFRELAVVAADALANSITMFDAPVVIGGGLSGAWDIILPTLTDELNKTFKTPEGKPLQRMELFAYNWQNSDCRADFLKTSGQKILIPGTDEWVDYDSTKKVCVGVSQLGTARAVALGAYAFALLELDKK